MAKKNWNEPIVGQGAALVRGARGAYLARFPYCTAGGRHLALEAAKAWRDGHAPTAAVLGFTGEALLQFDYSDGVKTYTAFVRSVDGHGTTWIQDVTGRDMSEAQLNAEAACASDWGCSVASVECIGLAEGSVTVCLWEE